MMKVKAYKTGQGHKFLDDFEALGVVDQSRDAFKAIIAKIETIEEEVYEEQKA